jgi:hypothetical protein
MGGRERGVLGTRTSEDIEMRGPAMMRPSRLIIAAVCVVAALTCSATAFATVVQEGNLRISISTRLQPYKLPRKGSAPITVFIAGHVFTADGTTPPQLLRMDVEINRHGRIDTEGLPVCRLSQIKATSTERALAACREALVGSGHFWASVVFNEEALPYHTTGRLLAFNGLRAGKPVLLIHIYTTQPFPSAFVVVFTIKKIEDGPYGTEFSASLPQALGDWGFVNRIKMNLGRTYHYQGKSHSYLNAACPAPQGFRTAVFPLAFATFTFGAQQRLAATVTKPCAVSE